MGLFDKYEHKGSVHAYQKKTDLGTVVAVIFWIVVALGVIGAIAG